MFQPSDLESGDCSKSAQADLIAHGVSLSASRREVGGCGADTGGEVLPTAQSAQVIFGLAATLWVAIGSLFWLAFQFI